jgi:hypothetical protein
LRFHGEHLLIDDLQHEWLATRFPEVDLYSNYREMDSWLACNPRRRPKNIERFIHRWMAKQKRREVNADYVLSDGVRCRVTAADRRTGRV